MPAETREQGRVPLRVWKAGHRGLCCRRLELPELLPAVLLPAVLLPAVLRPAVLLPAVLLPAVLLLLLGPALLS